MSRWRACILDSRACAPCAASQVTLPCAEACERNAILRHRGQPVILESSCDGCGDCLIACAAIVVPPAIEVAQVPPNAGEPWLEESTG